MLLSICPLFLLQTTKASAFLVTQPDQLQPSHKFKDTRYKKNNKKRKKTALDRKSVV